MKKGCIIAAVVIAVLIVVCGVVGYIFQQKVGNSPMVAQIETAVAEYQQKHPDAQVETSNEAWAAALTAEDAGISNAMLINFAARSGQFIDSYKNPLEFTKGADGKISVVSLGKDGKLGTDDDETSSF